MTRHASYHPVCCSTFDKLHTFAPKDRMYPLTHKLQYVMMTAVTPLPQIHIKLHFEPTDGVSSPVDQEATGTSYVQLYTDITNGLLEKQAGTRRLLIPPSPLRFAFLLEEELLA